MEIEEQEAKPTDEYEAQTYYFCRQACREEFLRQPEAYAPRLVV
jgi:YHS domain-containing protein